VRRKAFFNLNPDKHRVNQHAFKQHWGLSGEENGVTIYRVNFIIAAMTQEFVFIAIRLLEKVRI